MENENVVENKEESLKHLYFELENELLAKPNALCDLILINKLSPAVIFANTPSEADLVDSILNRNGIASAKLIGHVPYAKVVDSVKRAKDGQIQAVVITDVAARELDAGAFKVLVNYSVPEDPETYLHRFAGLNASSLLDTVISFVYPSDFSNFHYLKKIVEFDIELAQLPDKTDFYKESAAEFIAKAKEFTSEDKKLEVYMSMIKEQGDAENILPYLLNLALNQKALDKKPKKFDRPERQERNDRNDRYDRNDRSDRNDDRPERQERERFERKPERQQVRFTRIYVGHGSNTGLTAEGFSTIVADKAPTEIVKLSVRGNYSFVDVPQDDADTFIEKLSEVEFADGKNYFLKKATVISSFKTEEENKGETSTQDTQEGSSEEQNNDNNEEAINE